MLEDTLYRQLCSCYISTTICSISAFQRTRWFWIISNLTVLICERDCKHSQAHPTAVLWSSAPPLPLLPLCQSRWDTHTHTHTLLLRPRPSNRTGIRADEEWTVHNELLAYFPLLVWSRSRCCPLTLHPALTFLSFLLFPISLLQTLHTHMVGLVSVKPMTHQTDGRPMLSRLWVSEALVFVICPAPLALVGPLLTACQPIEHVESIPSMKEITLIGCSA